MNRPNAQELRQKAQHLREQAAKPVEPQVSEPVAIEQPKPPEPPKEPKKKKEKKPKQPVSEAEKRDNINDTYGRLPDGANFNVSYDATEKRWSGFLAIPGFEPIVGGHSGVFKLLTFLDREYRRVKLAKDQANKPAMEAV
jgi:hypothetical protein